MRPPGALCWRRAEYSGVLPERSDGGGVVLSVAQALAAAATRYRAVAASTLAPNFIDRGPVVGMPISPAPTPMPIAAVALPAGIDVRLQFGEIDFDQLVVVRGTVRLQGVRDLEKGGTGAVRELHACGSPP